MKITDKRFREILHQGMSEYVYRASNGKMAYMCIIINQLALDEKLDSQEAQAAIDRIGQRIDPCFSLYNYLREHPKQPTKELLKEGIQFYENWIDELQRKEDSAGLSDKEFHDILVHCLPIYKKQSEQGIAFMCNIIKHEARYGSWFAIDQAHSAEARILERISPFFTLYNYIERDTAAPTPIAQAIQFYEDWIEELRGRHETV